MRTRWTPLALALLALPMAAHAQDKDALYLRSLAATCANCHGTDGRTVDGSAVPGLAGMPRDYMVTQLAAFKSGARPATAPRTAPEARTERALPGSFGKDDPDSK